MRYRITRHFLVEEDLEKIEDYIAPFAGVKATSRILKELRTRINDLGNVPHIGTVRNEISPGLRALPAAEKAVICFTVDDATRIVKIVCVTYAGQDWQEIVRARE